MSVVSSQEDKSSGSKPEEEGKEKPCLLDVLSAKMDKERKYNKMRWGKEVITDEEISARKCTISAIEADKENKLAYRYLYEPHVDCVEDIKNTLKNINATCQEQLKKMED